jgi:hypothetical protein
MFRICKREKPTTKTRITNRHNYFNQQRTINFYFNSNTVHRSHNSLIMEHYNVDVYCYFFIGVGMLVSKTLREALFFNKKYVMGYSIDNNPTSMSWLENCLETCTRVI